MKTLLHRRLVPYELCRPVRLITQKIRKWRMSLKTQAINGVRWSAFSHLTCVCIQLIQVGVLARLLDPKDFGLMAIAQIVVGFSQIFADMGMSNAIIHNQTLTKGQLSSLYWLNVAAGCVVTGLLICLSPIIALIYKTTELTPILITLSSSFLIQGFGQQYFTILQRDLQFRYIALVEISGRVAGFLVSCLLATRSFGVLSLVYATLASALISTVGIMLIGRARFKPTCHFDYKSIRSFTAFGIYQMGEKFINYFNFQIDTLLVGWMMGPTTLGIYNMAKQLVMRPVGIINPIVTRVAMPLMSKVQSDERALANIYCRSLNYLASVNFLAYAILFMFADKIVLIYLGESWRDVIPILKILSVWAAVRSTANPVGALLNATGKAKRAFYWNLCLLAIAPPIVYLGSLHSLSGICFSQLLLIICLIIPTWLYLVRPICRVELGVYLWALGKPALITVAAGLLSCWISEYLKSQWLALTLNGIIFSFTWILLNFGYNAPLLNDLTHLVFLGSRVSSTPKTQTQGIK